VISIYPSHAGLRLCVTVRGFHAGAILTTMSFERWHNARQGRLSTSPITETWRGVFQRKRATCRALVARWFFSGAYTNACTPRQNSISLFYPLALRATSACFCSRTSPTSNLSGFASLRPLARLVPANMTSIPGAGRLFSSVLLTFSCSSAVCR